MLPFIEIRNYRCFKHLHIKKLGRVNLILGKNNTGKTALLEGIYTNLIDGDIIGLIDMLVERGELKSKNSTLTTEDYLSAFTSLFNGRTNTFSKTGFILLKSIKEIRIEIVKFIENIIVSTHGEETVRVRENKEVYDDKLFPDDKGVNLGFKVSNGENLGFFRISPYLEKNLMLNRYNLKKNYKGIRFVKSIDVVKENNADLWDNVTIKGYDSFVYNALNIFESRYKVNRLAFLSDREDGRTRSAFVMLDSLGTVPLKSMGDGINRILTFVLAMVNAENGYLLIDEIENGLHWSVQEKLWEVIFMLADRLNIQVFATTHSRDTMEAFSEVLNRQEHNSIGLAIRLEQKDDDIQAVLLDAETLHIATEHDINLR